MIKKIKWVGNSSEETNGKVFYDEIKQRTKNINCLKCHKKINGKYYIKFRIETIKETQLKENIGYKYSHLGCALNLYIEDYYNSNPIKMKLEDIKKIEKDYDKYIVLEDL